MGEGGEDRDVLRYDEASPAQRVLDLPIVAVVLVVRLAIRTRLPATAATVSAHPTSTSPATPKRVPLQLRFLPGRRAMGAHRRVASHLGMFGMLVNCTRGVPRTHLSFGGRSRAAAAAAATGSMAKRRLRAAWMRMRKSRPGKK